MLTSPPVLPPPSEELLLLLLPLSLLPHAATPNPVSAVSTPTARTLPTLLIKSLSPPIVTGSTYPRAYGAEPYSSNGLRMHGLVHTMSGALPLASNIRCRRASWDERTQRAPAFSPHTRSS